MRAALAVPLACLLLLLLPAAAGGGGSAPAAGKAVAVDLGATLPTGLGGFGAVWMAGAVYAFGGVAHESGEGGSDQVLRIDPDTGKAVVLPVRAPARMMHAMVATDGKHAYIFGTMANQPTADGKSVTEDDTRGIYRFDPASGKFTTMESTMPYRLVVGQAVWDGARFRVFGSCPDAGGCEVLDYDPATDTLSATPVHGAGDLRPAFSQGRVALVEGTFYVFPAYTMTPSTTVYRYDAATGEAVALPTPLAEPRKHYGIVAVGSRVLLVGGGVPVASGAVPYDQGILEYDVVQGWSATSCVSLPDYADSPAVVQTPAGLLLVGAGTRDASRHVYRFDPAWLETCDARAPAPDPKPAVPQPDPAAHDDPDSSTGLDKPLRLLPAALPAPGGGVLEAQPLTGAVAITGSLEVEAGGALDLDAGGARVRYECGRPSCALDVTVAAATDASALDGPLPPLPGASLYLEAHDRSATPATSVVVAMPVADPGDGAWSIHYFDGDGWVDLATAGRRVEGATDAHDLEVFDTGYDPDAKVAWARVGHTSAYAVAPTAPAAAAPAPAAAAGIPWTEQPAVLWGAGIAVAAVLAVELAVLAAVVRRRA